MKTAKMLIKFLFGTFKLKEHILKSRLGLEFSLVTSNAFSVEAHSSLGTFKLKDHVLKRPLYSDFV
jgi:hypothetical protein